MFILERIKNKIALFFCISVLCSISMAVSAQSLDIATSRHKLIKEKQDSTRIDIMLSLVLRYLHYRTDSSFYFAQEALKLAEKTNDLLCIK
jgi:hypothetical protein